MKLLIRVGTLAGTLAVAGAAACTILKVDVGSTRGPADRDAAIDHAVRQFARNAAILTKRERAFRSGVGPFTLPITVKLEGLSTTRSTRGGGSITLSFDATGARSFPTQYRDFLNAVFTEAQPFLDLFAGSPSESGVVRVRNYDADIGDRDAVAGGAYVHDNGSGDREIRFPIYQDIGGFKPEVSAVNFIHCLMLAYIGSKNLPTDGWQEGITRAVVMKVARTPGALPAGLDQNLVEGVLSGTYDNGTHYEWCNQRALGGPTFIAPNLRSVALPVGGSVGGLYLLRYMMAGSAFQKVLVQYPNFARDFLSRYYLNPSLYQTGAQLRALGQVAIDQGGGSGSLIEDRSFSGWALHQFILEPRLSQGQKLLVQPFPIVDGLVGSDFGVFAIQAHWFETKANGDETLLRETSYPIFWSPTYLRVFAAAQDDRVDIIQGYGSVVPNFVGTPFAGAKYRVMVDVPVQDKLERVYLPAGAIATAANPQPNDLYGSIVGQPDKAGTTYRVYIQQGSTTIQMDASHLAFGGVTPFSAAGTLTINLMRMAPEGNSIVLTRSVNKGPGPLALNLEVFPRSSASISLGGGINLVGMNIDPLLTSPGDVLGTGDGTLAARWNGLKGRYEFFPELGSMPIGTSAFVRSNTARTFNVSGRAPANTAMSVALRPGWNLIANPTDQTLTLTDLQVIKESDFPVPYAEASGTVLGTDLFTFNRGNNDGITGFPEYGTFVSATALEPGQACMVRCLNPAGATLVFLPLGSRDRTAPPILGQRWFVAATLSAGRDRAEVRFGATTGGSAQIDERNDAIAAPALGGLAMKMGSLFRDTRAYGPSSSYFIQLSGLTPGRSYRIDFSRETGAPPQFWVIDNSVRFKRKQTVGSSYTFTANTPSRTLQINTERQP